MKKTILLLLLCLSFVGYTQVQNATFNVSPTTFEETEQITITVSNINPSAWGVSDVYLWAWSLDNNNANTQDAPNNGTWANSNEAQKLTNNGNGSYSITFTPTTFYNRTNIGSIGMLVKAKNGTGDKKTQDQIFKVGKFQLTLNTPTASQTIINAGDTFPINANASVAANFILKANGTVIDSQNNKTVYSYSNSITENTNYTLEATSNGEQKTLNFTAIVKPTVVIESLPAGLKDGVNLNKTDATKATFVFYAPEKEFIHLIGDFNNWTINNNYLLKKDGDRFWIEVSNLTPQKDHLYQYLIEGVLRVADPYSTVILSEYNDQYINSTTYPNLPAYPTGKTNHAVTLLKTGETPYNWQVTNFQKPKKTDLVIYELLIRDFDELHSFDAVKARLDYLENLGVNAIEFLPIMEFDGNESWGYNPSFHMALDKYYGTKKAFKQLVDECHKRGIAVILDVAFNHASGQNPYYRMYNTDNGGYAGQATSNSPFFNVTAKHSYSVFNDFNHSKQAVKDYVKRIAQFWIEEYKIDGYRWDLTKGFTQNCTENDQNCTNSFQQDRVDILKEYADYQWEIDQTSYVIFEHLGTNAEETEWVNYKLNEGKGIMVWGNQNYNYRKAIAGDISNSDFSWVSYKNRGWSVPANISYMESHDEERLLYEAKNNGLVEGSYNIKNTNIALERAGLVSAFYFTIPGPKMIWQFGELGYDIGINQNGRTGNKPILWNYFDTPNRKNLYTIYSKLIELKLKYDIFETSNFTIDINTFFGLHKIQLSDINASNIQHITIVGNFDTKTQNINPNFQTTGTWYSLLDNNSSINVTNTNSTLSLNAGEFKIFANKPATLSTKAQTLVSKELIVYPNSIVHSFQLNQDSKNINIYSVNGKKVKTFTGEFSKNQIFNIQDLSSGIYFLKAFINNKLQVYKIIKE
ncbi:alpha-amylase family glycosyl hydrolase [Polaribacter tangerinus]|uniref:alpha-amylase family glycosyl hydrolase n=1 Tax=Polaribacter tangerinus TaxID=1920034 RepID=UPI000B4AF3BB|nr:alpha-amylase family glycosyl hydrolase [Polaribacter tangerinus]